MSRSIHTTRRGLGRLNRQDFSDPKIKAELLEEGIEELSRKRRIKGSIHDERSEAPLAGVAVPEFIPIELHDAGPHVHHLFNEADLRSLLQALPATAAEGISKIQLLLGKQYIDEQCAEDAGERDPFTGRLSYEIFPGIHAGTVLGTYSPRSGRIALHAFVYDEECMGRLPLPALACRGYLRLHALKTFIHEVAHHHDRAARGGRGRWLADRTATVENYAERMEYEWTRQIGLRWLEGRFPEEISALLHWLEEFGGIRLPLAFFAGDPRTTERNGRRKLVYSTNEAFESFVTDLAGLEAPQSASKNWLAFAWEVHFADDYELCLQLLERIVARKPDMIEAQICQADTLVHLDRIDEAFQIVTQVLETDPGQTEAWEVRASVWETRQQWEKLLEICLAWEAAAEPDSSARRQLLIYRAIACCALERWPEMEDLIALRILDRHPRYAQILREMVFRRAGQALRPAPAS